MSDTPSASFSGWHDVFISHRGPAMKLGFADCLYHDLKKNGIRAFLDKEEIPKGDDARTYMLEAARRVRV